MALALDFVLLATVHFLLFLLSAGWLSTAVMDMEPLAILVISASYLFVVVLSFIFLHVVYFTCFHAWYGQTLGKMVMGIRVVTTDDVPVSPSVAFLRWTGYILSSLPLAAGFLWAVVDKDHCAWHDRLAGTRVVPTEMT